MLRIEKALSNATLNRQSFKRYAQRGRTSIARDRPKWAELSQPALATPKASLDTRRRVPPPFAVHIYGAQANKQKQKQKPRLFGLVCFLSLSAGAHLWSIIAEATDGDRHRSSFACAASVFRSRVPVYERLTFFFFTERSTIANWLKPSYHSYRLSKILCNLW